MRPRSRRLRRTGRSRRLILTPRRARWRRVSLCRQTSFPSPYANNVAAAAANNNAIPPDLSLMTKARHRWYGLCLFAPDRVSATAGGAAPKFPDVKTPAGLHYNPYFANLNLAMAPPLTAEGQVTYGEGQPKPTVDQMAKDVAAFLTWTAEPKMESRKSAGPRGAALPPRRDDAGLHVLPEHLGRNQALSLGPDRLKQRGGSARSRPFSCRWLGMPLIPTKVFGGALYACRFLLSC
jgi:hypothetical protein